MSQVQVITQTDNDGGGSVLPENQYAEKFLETIKQIKNKSLIKDYFDFLRKAQT